MEFIKTPKMSKPKKTRTKKSKRHKKTVRISSLSPERIEYSPVSVHSFSDTRPDINNWETTAIRSTIEYKNNIYDIIELPRGTHIFRGFNYGWPEYLPKEGDDMEEIHKYNEKRYTIGKSGVYYGNLGVGSLYAITDPFGGVTYPFRILVEYEVTEPIKLLEMTPRNIKHILAKEKQIKKAVKTHNETHEDYREQVHWDTEPLREIFKHAYGYNHDNIRQSDAEYDSTVKHVVQYWLRLTDSPKLEGFASGSSAGFHSELAIFTREHLEEICEYHTDYDHPIMKEGKGKCPQNELELDDIDFMQDGEVHRLTSYYKKVKPPNYV